jgi:hypothetical protein
MDDEPRRIKKKKKKKKMKVKKRQTEEDDALSAFGIAPREGSGYKAAAGLSPQPRRDDGEEPPKKKKKKVRKVKKIRKKKLKKVKKVVPKPEEHEEVRTVEPKVREPEPPVVPKEETRPDPPVVPKEETEPEDVKTEADDDDPLDDAEDLLDDIDLDKLTESIGSELLESFEEKIDNILDDIIDEEVEDLTEAEAAVKDSVKGGAPDIPAPAHSGRTEVEARPEIKMHVESPTKTDGLEEEVVLEKDETKMISDKKPTKAKKTKAESKGIKIQDGDVRERRVAYKVAHNFEKLPPNMRNELLKTLSKVDDPRVREDVVSAITTHFKNLPPEIQALLTNLARDKVSRVREEVVFEIQRNFDNISAKIKERILKALVMDEEASVREEVMSTICQHYGELSTDVKELLETLAKDKARSVRDELSFEMAKADSPVPKEVREDILAILKGKK